MLETLCAPPLLTTKIARYILFDSRVRQFANIYLFEIVCVCVCVRERKVNPQTIVRLYVEVSTCLNLTY
jgi:hypothetical protein